MRIVLAVILGIVLLVVPIVSAQQRPVSIRHLTREQLPATTQVVVMEWQ